MEASVAPKRPSEAGGREPKRQALLPRDEDSFGELMTAPNSDNVSTNPSRSPNWSQYETVCFGCICDTSIQVRNDPLTSTHSGRSTSVKGAVVLELSFREATFWVRCPDGELFGCLTTRVAQGLKRLEALPHAYIEIEAVAPLSTIQKARSSWKRSGRSATSVIDINIYGNPRSAKAVGDALTSAKMFLQPPNFQLRSLPYDNPQYLKLPNVSDVGNLSRNDVGVPEGPSDPVPQASKSEIEAILDHIPQPSFLRAVSADVRIITTLVKHQREAVDFMVRRETGDLPPSLSLWKPQCSQNGFFFYQNVITGAKNSSIDDPLGGILADDMGLGKTLVTLAVVIASLARALDFAVAKTRAPPSHWQNVVPSKTTLVVLPSSLLLDSWTEEIEKHILPGTVRVYRYHGARKRTSLSDLLSCDIVLTTYATVAAEFCRGQSILSRVEWYRLILDEAHTIRNPSTRQFRAIHSTAAHIRWCLTGTPIQNTLEDLGALVKFLRVPILEDLKTFRKYITVPVHSNASGRFANLRRLLESLCLRRTKNLLRLPEPVIDTQMLELSAMERETYHGFGASCRRAIDLAVSGHSIKKANHHVVQAVLGMRLFCNHGPTAFAGRWHSLGLPSDPEEALSYLQASGKSSCVLCDSEVLTMYQADDRSSGVLTTCQHLICGECLPSFESDLDDNLEDRHTSCPVCGLRGARNTFIVEPSGYVGTASGRPFPTKLLALLRNVQNQNSNNKCVIFSYWKKTLDIVAEMFRSNGIPFLRVHGSLPSGKRGKILAEFELSTSIKVLLITFGTGAVGINKLMVANHIHILEPQWNPSVESQAIGRILRLGQERSVKIVRYIMKDTVEEAVQSQQLRKLQLAGGGFGLSNDGHASQRIQEIMNLLCPSKST